MPDFPTGTVTFLFTDIEGSTQLAQQHPDSWEDIRAHHHAVLREACEAHHGYVFQIIGDAFCVAFPTAPDALAAAIGAQRRLTVDGRELTADGRRQTADEAHQTSNAQQAAIRRPPSAVSSSAAVVLRVRMGLHTGAAELRDGNYHGYLTLVQVQRVMSVAFGGQMLVSNASAALLTGQLPMGVVLRDLGEHRLKGLLNPEHLWQVNAPGLPHDFPPLTSLNAIPNNLPIQVTSFIGRERDLEELRRLLPTTRLLTLTGSGGTGKTRLSLQLAADVLDAYHDGVWFVELAPLADAALVVVTVASVLDVREEPGRPLLNTLLDWLRPKQLLLILDNCEHLIEACARFADAVLHAGRETRILASSREALGIAGELAWRVPSLATPGPHENANVQQLEQYAAVRLFIERALFVQPAFSVTNANAPAVAQICYRLEGIPLALELAAARVKTLSVDKIAERLDDRFRLLTGGSRTALPRQQTLRGTIDWSHSILSEPERILLRRLSVFAGGWTLDDAEAVCGDDQQPTDDRRPKTEDVGSRAARENQRHSSPVFVLPSADVLDLLTHLVDKSLVVLEDHAAESRYRMLETIRQYAREKLMDAGESERLRDQQLDFFMRLSQEAGQHLFGDGQVAWLDRLERELDNLRFALEWSLASGQIEAGLRLAGSPLEFWYLRNHQGEGASWLQSLLARRATVCHPSVRATALNARGYLLERQGHFKEALQMVEEAHSISVTNADNENILWSKWILGRLAFDVQEYAKADALLEECLALSFAVGGSRWVAGAHVVLGDNALVQNLYVRAQTFYAETINLTRTSGDKNVLPYSLRRMGQATLLSGEIAGALPYCRESLAINWEVRDRQGTAASLTALAAVALAQDRPLYAAELLGAADAALHSIQTQLLPYDLAQYNDTLATLRGKLDEQTFVTEYEKGRALAVPQAVALALDQIQT